MKKALKKHILFQLVCGLLAVMVSFYSMKAGAVLVACMAFSMILCLLDKWHENLIEYEKTYIS